MIPEGANTYHAMRMHACMATRARRFVGKRPSDDTTIGHGPMRPVGPHEAYRTNPHDDGVCASIVSETWDGKSRPGSMAVGTPRGAQSKQEDPEDTQGLRGRRAWLWRSRRGLTASADETTA